MKTQFIVHKRDRMRLTHKKFSFNPTSIIKLLTINLYTLIIIFSLSSCGVDLDEDNGVKTMAAGSEHTVAIKKDGTLWAWGRNLFGQLGDGTTNDSSVPVQIIEPGPWIAVSAGRSHTVAIKSNGSLWAWGENDEGQLGVGTSGNKSNPVQVGTGTDWIAVSAGSTYTVAIKTDYSLWSWGSSSQGQLGHAETPTNTPHQVGTDKDWITVSAGSSHTVAIKSDGFLWAWGNNADGQLGLGESSNTKTFPVQVKDESGSGYLEDVIAVSAGGYHTVAIDKYGKLWAWGNNANGQLGLGESGSGNYRTIPVQIDAGSWIAVFTGNNHTIALKKNGTLWSWGHNFKGQLGLGEKKVEETISRPERLGEAADLVGVSGGVNHSIALRRSGILWTWGENTYGQLGNGTPSGMDEYSPRPVAVKWP